MACLEQSGFGSATAGHSIALVYGTLVMALFALMLLEQIFRGADIDTRWAVKYLCLGVGTLFAYDFVIYADALASHSISITAWNARGLVDTLAAAMLAAAIKRQSTIDRRMQTPRKAFLRSSALIFGGGYLLFVALGRYAIHNLGGSWSNVIAVTFVVAAVAGLIILALSGQARARGRVLLGKYVFRYRYDYRDVWLALTDQLSRTQDGLDPEKRTIQAVAGLLDSPAGALWMARNGQYRCVSDWNLREARDTSIEADAALVAHIEQTDSVVSIAGQSNADRSPAACLPDWITCLPRAWLLMPIFSDNGLLGFLVLTAPRAPYRLTWEEIDLLRTVGRQVGVYLHQQDNSRALARTRQFDAFNRLTAFLMHDLKNIANQQSLMLQNAAKHKRDPAFVDDLVLTIEQSVERMNDLLARIRGGSDCLDHALVRVDDAIGEAIAPLAKREPLPEFEPNAVDEVVDVDPRQFKTVLANLVRNAQDATDASGRVSVSTLRQDHDVLVGISDTGSGMSESFVYNNLFEPFYTTKSAQGMGIGAYEAREFAQGAGGDLDVSSEPGQGTTITLRLPRARSSVASDASTLVRTDKLETAL